MIKKFIDPCFVCYFDFKILRKYKSVIQFGRRHIFCSLNINKTNKLKMLLKKDKNA